MIKDKVIIPYFETLHEDDRRMMVFMKNAWDSLNKAKFEGKLARPNFRFLKRQPIVRMRGRGLWQSKTRTLAMNRRCFCEYDTFYDTFLHEMCHQAVHELDKLGYREANEGHGPVWRAWMVKVGLEPLQYDPLSNRHYMSEQERVQYDTIIHRRSEATKEQMKIRPSDNRPAKYFDAKTSEWHIGVIACRHDQEGKRWAFVTVQNIKGWKVVPSDWFCSVTNEELAKIHQIDPRRVQEAVSEYHRRRNLRRAKRHVKATFWSIL